MILRADGSVVRSASTGAPLGLLPPGLPYGETGEVLHPGDALVLFSDGVTDAQDAADEEFGEARLLEVLRPWRASPPTRSSIGSSRPIDAFVADTPQFDDMTMLVVRRSSSAKLIGVGPANRSFSNTTDTKSA